MAEPSVTPELQQKLQRLQQLSQQLQSVAQQRNQYEMLRSESQRATEALQDLADDATVYRSVGGLMIKDSKATALERVSDDMETMDVRLKRARDQEAQLQQELQTLQAEAQKAFQDLQ